MKFLYNRKSSSLLSMLIALTLLFISAQLSLFYIYYKVSNLVDSLVNTSIALQLLNPIILIPVLKFILIQVLAYVFFIGWIWFTVTSISEYLRLTKNQTSSFAFVTWSMACLALLSLNNYYYPDSFFSKKLMQLNFFNQHHLFFLIASVTFFFAATFIAYINYFKNKRYYKTGSALLFLFIFLSVSYFYEESYTWISSAQQNSKPNIIFIGLDSLRPDFTHYYSAKSINTPNIDQFLNQSVKFSHAYTPLARTFPTWISILTAKYPKHHLARNNLVNQQEILQQDTLAKHLQQAGYETLYATDEKRFSNITTHYGFDRVLGPAMGVNDFILGSLSDFPMSNLLINLPIGRFLFPYNFANRAAAITYNPNSFLQLLRVGLSKRTNKPLFLAVHLCLSHWPFTWAHNRAQENFYMPNQYKASVEGVDKQLGELLKILHKQGLLKNTMVVLLSDHGTAMGMQGDRFIHPNNYQGDVKKLKLIPVTRLSSASENSLNYKRDYTMNTAYGQGTNVLSFPQHHVLLAFQQFGTPLTPKKITTLTSLIDIAPTILDWLNLSPMLAIDGISLRNYFQNENVKTLTPRAFFMETGDSMTEIETDHIYIEKVLKHEIGIYTINKDGLLMLNAPAEKSIIKNKQLAIMQGDWILAHYPANLQKKWVMGKNKKSKLVLKSNVLPSYFVLANLKTGKWTLSLSSPLAKKAPVNNLMQQLRDFYGDEIPHFCSGSSKPK